MLLDDIAAYLAAQGIGTQAVDLFEAWMPDEPDSAVCVYEYPGGRPALAAAYDNPHIQVRVRDLSYAAGRTKIGAIQNLLHGKAETVLVAGGVSIMLIAAIQSPGSIGRDQHNRTEWVQNYEVLVRRS